MARLNLKSEDKQIEARYFQDIPRSEVRRVEPLTSAVRLHPSWVGSIPTRV